MQWPIIHSVPVYDISRAQTEASNAASEDRTHDLRSMRPTRCQLRYRRFATSTSGRCVLRFPPQSRRRFISNPRPIASSLSGKAFNCDAGVVSPMGLWRNGSACDSRSQGWEFESLWPHFHVFISLPCSGQSFTQPQYMTSPEPRQRRLMRRVRIKLTTLGL
jgi:hypothetical protein